MRSEPATSFELTRSATGSYQVVRRPSATFLVLRWVAGAGPEPGTVGGEIAIAGVRAPCGISVLEGGSGGEVWCRPRGPLPLLGVGDEAILRFDPPRSPDRR
ncbi:MAG: hypothetical protein JSS97_12970 [Actinobacteria bacterium]|nr:hypothetical protein [Actinomycetota bacterium]